MPDPKPMHTQEEECPLCNIMSAAHAALIPSLQGMAQLSHLPASYVGYAAYFAVTLWLLETQGAQMEDVEKWCEEAMQEAAEDAAQAPEPGGTGGGSSVGGVGGGPFSGGRSMH